MTAFESVTERVLEVLRERCGVDPKTPTWVACSGGADSVALAHVLHAIQPACQLEGLVFIDHGLRDVTEERLAAEQCARQLNVAFEHQGVRVEAIGNVQEAARDARYGALETIVPKDAVIATGHTLTDQAETVLQRLIRGSGIRGLQGIHPRRGRWIRPLLTVRREETRHLGFHFVDDPTNVTAKYMRNRIRAEVLPLLVRENPQVEAALAKTAEQAHAELVLVDALVSMLGDDVDLSGLPLEWVHALTRWQYREQFPDIPPPRNRALSRLSEHLQKGLTTRRFSIGNGVRATAEDGVLSFSGDNDSRRSVVLHGPGAYALNHEVIKVHEQDTKVHDTEIESNSPVFFDAVHLVWPLVMRPHQPSDRILQSDTGRKTSVVDALRKEGISWNAKTRKNVLIDGLGRVLWVGGIGRTSIATPTKHTRRCVVVTFASASELLI